MRAWTPLTGARPLAHCMGGQRARCTCHSCLPARTPCLTKPALTPRWYAARIRGTCCLLVVQGADSGWARRFAVDGGSSTCVSPGAGASHAALGVDRCARAGGPMCSSGEACTNNAIERMRGGRRGGQWLCAAAVCTALPYTGWARYSMQLICMLQGGVQACECCGSLSWVLAAWRLRVCVMRCLTEARVEQQVLCSAGVWTIPL